MNEREEAAYMEWRRGIFGDDIPDSDDIYRVCFKAALDFALGGEKQSLPTEQR